MDQIARRERLRCRLSLPVDLVIAIVARLEIRGALTYVTR